MTRGALLASVALGLAVPAGAQEGGDKARLDDFAVPRADTGQAIEQVDATASRIGAEQALPSDRQLAVPGPAVPAREPMSQLSQPDQRGATRQVGDRGQSRNLAPSAVSSSQDSRPQPSAALAGEDRCDPQSEAERAECAQILERRAAEFQAAEPPRLSAEQVLLAGSEEDADSLATSSSRVRLRLASANDPDADLQSNQELAAIYLRRTAGEPAPADAGETAEDAGLAEVLQALQISLPGAPAP